MTVATSSSLASSFAVDHQTEIPPSRIKIPPSRIKVPPSRIRSNFWRSIPVAPAESFEPWLRVTVVVPYFEAPEKLAITFAGLERQTYPADLFEVVVVDDGSAIPLELSEPTPLNVKVIHQEDRGFGLARARNNGARNGSGDVIVFLDCDMVPEDDWLMWHARWHHAACDLVSLGFRHHVEFDGITTEVVRNMDGSLEDLLKERQPETPQWIERRIARSDDLNSDDDEVFGAVTGGNFAMSAEFFNDVGGFDESFTQWGSEDTEFGWRAYMAGAVFVPERKALCWHQGPGATPSDAEEVSLLQQRAKVTHLIPHRVVRAVIPGRSYTVPQVVVTIEAVSAGEKEILATVEQVLASRFHDLVVWLAAHPAEEFKWLQRQLNPDPRVVTGDPEGAVQAFPNSPFHVRIPAGATVNEWMIGKLTEGIKYSVSGSADLVSGHRVTITRTWAIHRAQRSGLQLADVGDIVELDGKDPSIIYGQRQPSRVAKAADRGQALVTTFGELLLRALKSVFRIRSLRDAWSFVCWSASGTSRHTRKLIWKLGQKFKSKSWKAPRMAHYPLGAEIVAVGTRSSDVFAASSRVESDIQSQNHIDVIVVDTPQAAQAIFETDNKPPLPQPTNNTNRTHTKPNSHQTTGDTNSAPNSHQITNETTVNTARPALVVLSENHPKLSVQAFDPLVVNPIGWTPDHKRYKPPKPGELVPMEVEWLRVPRGVVAGWTIVQYDRLARLRSFHHMEDSAKYHSDTTRRTALLAALAGSGVVVHITDHDSTLKDRLGPELYELMAQEQIVHAKSHQREQFCIAIRRAALREHSLRSRARQILSVAGIDSPPPDVSVLVVTRRPECLMAIAESIAKQTYPKLEVVFAFVGESFDPSTINQTLRLLDCHTTTLKIPDNQPLGTVLNAATAASSGTLITRFDDRDHYGPEHVWDLVLAHEYSQAELVGKPVEYLYFIHRDKTIRDVNHKLAESYLGNTELTEGVLMISRQDLAEAGGWQRISTAVNVCLARDVMKMDGRVYWTHGSGFLRVHHSGKHTQTVDDGHFLWRAVKTRDGCDFDFAGF